MNVRAICEGQFTLPLPVASAVALFTPDETRVTVRYDVTSLGPDGAAFITELEEGYDAFLGEWRGEILAGLARERDDATRAAEDRFSAAQPAGCAASVSKRPVW